MNTTIISVIVLLAISFRMFVHFLDKRRVYEAAESNGWHDIQVAWAPLAPGALFERTERSYFVTYTDQQGLPSQIFCKTSVLTGVFWRTDDKLTESNKVRDMPSSDDGLTTYEELVRLEKQGRVVIGIDRPFARRFYTALPASVVKEHTGESPYAEKSIVLFAFGAGPVALLTSCILAILEFHW